MMELPKTITSIISFEIAKLHIENNKRYYGSDKKENKKIKKLLRLTTRYIRKLMQLGYDQTKIYYNDTEFTINKNKNGKVVEE